MRPGNIYIAGCGSYLPARRITNDDVESTTSFDRGAKGCSLEAWATKRHGGRIRHWADDGEATSDLAIAAARAALQDAGVFAEQIELIVMATFTSDHPIPPSVARVQAALGCRGKFLQIDAACTGFVDAMWVASSLMRQHGFSCALVVAGDILSRLSRPTDFLPRTVFGDGAGATVLQWHDDPTTGVLEFATGSDGELADYVLAPAGGSRMPFTPERFAAGEHYWRLRFSDIHEWALQRLVHCSDEVLRISGLTSANIDWFVPHQASVTIVRKAALLLGLPEDRTILTYGDTGNTSGASIPVALAQGKQRGLFQGGQRLLMAAVGAGMAWGGFSYRWPHLRERGA